MEDMKLLLVGNPNAGKSTLFNRLTRGHARVGNWHGVTVDALEGTARENGHTMSVVDLPGLYSDVGRSMEEKFAADYISGRPDAVLVFVSEYAGLERALPLMQAFAKKRRAALVLTKRRPFERAGGKLDREELARRLSVPVFDGEEKGLKERLFALGALPPCTVGEVSLEGVYVPPEAGLSRADSILLCGFFGLPLFFLLLVGAFFVTFARGMPGDLMKSGVNWLFEEFLGGYAARIPSPAVRSLVQDGILRSLGSVLSVLPQIAMLQLTLILLEESGLMSRLAVLTDGALSKIGLSGRAVFSLLMGFGCTAAAILSTRGLDDKKIQRRVILCLPYLSCSAKLPVFLALSASFFEEPFLAVLLLYALGVGISAACALFLKEKAPPMVAELAPLQLPRPVFVVKSLLFQIKQFIIKIATTVLAFFLASWLLSSFDFTFTLCTVEESMLAKLCGGLGFLFAPAGMGDWRITYAAVSGLIAKENVAGAIALFFGEFPYSAESAFAFAVFLLTCSPCVSAIAASARELGWGNALLNALFQTVSALLLCYLVYFCLTGYSAFALLALIPVAASFLLESSRDTLHRLKTRPSFDVHRRNLRRGFGVLPRPAQGEGDTRQRRKGERRPFPSGGGYRRLFFKQEAALSPALPSSLRGRKRHCRR